MPPPVPPSVNEGRMMAGRPISSTAASALISVLTCFERGVSSPMRCIASRKSSRSSALSMAWAVAPIMVTSKRASTPIRLSDNAVLSAVCPPMVGSSPNPPAMTWRSFSMILATIYGVIGVGHDRRRIGVDQHDPITLGFERLDRLRAGIVELAGLPDDDWPRADDEDRGEVGPRGHIAGELWAEGTKKGRALRASFGRRRGCVPARGALFRLD